MHCKLLENHLYIAANGEYRMCCVSNEAANKETVYTHTPVQWLESTTIKTAKDQLANGQWPSSCNKCKEEEALGIESRRILKDWYGPGITHLDLRFGNSCNLKCISCYPGSSSSIADEVMEMREQLIIPLYPVSKQTNNNWYDEKFVDYFNGMPLQEVYLTGGEPMMVKHLYAFLKTLDRNVTIRFNTNVTVFNPQIHELLKEFKKVIMSLSVDAIGKRAEYIRYGTSWELVEENSARYADHFEVNVTPTISVLNAAYYNEIVDWAKERNFKIYENFLITPEWLHIKNAPDSLKSKFNLSNSWKDEPANQYQQLRFIKNINKLDNFRNIKIKDYLPEVAAAYGID